VTLWRRYEFETLNPRAIGWLGRPVHRPSLVGEDGAKDLVDVEELADGCSGFNLFLEEGLGLLQVLSRLQDGGGVFARNDHNSVAVHDNDVAGRYWTSSALDGHAISVRTLKPSNGQLPPIGIRVLPFKEAAAVSWAG